MEQTTVSVEYTLEGMDSRLTAHTRERALQLEILTLVGDDAWSRRDDVGEIYRQGFDSSHEQAEQFIELSFAHILEYEGAILLLANVDGQPAGILYGYTYKPNQWWSKHVASSIINAGYMHYLDDAFSLAELAVLPEFQGKGVGSALLRKLLDNQPQRYTLLSTSADPEKGATKLYERFGFKVIVSLFRYSQTSAAVHIMAAGN